MTTWAKLTQTAPTARAPQREDERPQPRHQDDAWASDAPRRRAIDQAPRRAGWIPRRAGWLRGGPAK
jgi:hypothetical protein